VLEAEGSELRLHQPVIYQEINGTRQSVDGSFVIQEENQVGFEVVRYDTSKPLIIDPVLSYSTYLGGSGRDLTFGIAVDSSGNAYVTGSTQSNNFPTANAFQAAYGGGTYDAFVTKLNASGSALVYSTFLGGSGGDDWALGIAVDSSGNAYVTGSTQSANFPTANAFQAAFRGSADAFVTKLNADGSALVYSTFLGDGSEGYGIDVDSSGNAYVTGRTKSSNFPTANAFQAAIGGGSGTFPGDAFVTKFNAAGSALEYSTYLGGSGNDQGNSIAVDSSGNAYVTGWTASTSFHTANAIQAAYGGGASDAFVTKLVPTGSALEYSTYLGGSGNDGGSGIAVDSSGNAYVAGWTNSTDFHTANAIQAAIGGGGFTDAFVTKLNASGSSWYSTYLGGRGSDQGWGIAADSSGNAYVTGYTLSTNFPTVNAFQAAYGGGFSVAFVTELNATGSGLVYSTYLGNNNTNNTRFPLGDLEPGGIAVDSSGNAYVTGNTNSTNFPTANAFQPTYGAASGTISSDAFVTKFPAVTAGAPPQLPQGSLVNNASYAPGSNAVAPGTIVAIFGSNLTNGTSCLPPSCNPTFGSNGRLNTTMTGAQVTINGTPVPIFYSSPNQLGVQIPTELTGASASVQVTVNGQASAPQTIAIAPLTPGIFTFTSDGKGAGAFTHVDGSPVTVTQQNPARRGELVILYATGLGQVTPSVPTGALPTGASATVAATTLTIDGITVIPEFAGLAGCCVGLNQVNVRLPANTRSGSNIPVVLTIGGVASNPVNITVQ
jgi:uncharacterized protein (TIGR03437 family)